MAETDPIVLLLKMSAKSVLISSLEEQIRGFREVIQTDCDIMHSKLQRQPKRGIYLLQCGLFWLIKLPSADDNRDLALLNETLTSLATLQRKTEEIGASVLGPEAARLRNVTVEEVRINYIISACQ